LRQQIMIGYLEGTVIKVQEDGILLLAGHVGYEILLSSEILKKIKAKNPDERVSLYIYYHQTERQPRPVLIGFDTEEEKAFFQLFISVDAIGPLKAVKAMEKPVLEIAAAIENKDVSSLSTLKGIGKRTAQKIIAALHGKTARFINGMDGAPTGIQQEDVEGMPAAGHSVTAQVVDVLVEQLGHPPAAAREMVARALKRNSSISTPEQLFDEVYKGVGHDG